MLSHYEAMYPACDMDVPCFATELEQDIARLEAEADRDEVVSFPFMEAPKELGAGIRPLHKCLSDDVASMQDQTAHTSDDDSDDGGEEDAQWAQVRENALMVSQSGTTLLPGAWRGCAKSPWCDREDRHRGLCNHRATIAGPAAMPTPAPASEQEESEEEQQEQDTCHLDDGVCEAAACADVLRQAADDQQDSGGHSHNQAQDAGIQGDELEVDSAQQTDHCMEHFGVQHQHSTSQVQLQVQVAAAAAGAGPVRSTISAEDELSQDLFWGGNAGQLAAAELFSIPAAYQPRVKDLTGPGAPCLLSVHSMRDQQEMSTPLAAPLAAPMAEPVEELHAVAYESTSSDYSDHTNAKACTTVNNSASSTPSSPSCASASAAAADLAAFGPFQPAVLAATPSADVAVPSAAVTEEAQHQQQQQCDTSSPCTPESSTDFSINACADADESAALAAAAAAAASACAEAEAAAAAAAAAFPVVTVAVGGTSSAQVAFEQAAAEAVAAAAAAAAMATSCMSPTAGITPSVIPDGSPPAANAAGLAGVQRPPRIKSKPSNSLMKAAAVVDASCSPKSKKRPAARLASNPGGAHCCTSCGAVSTPVWRAGPAGPKTLCNACGVRYMKVAKRK